MPNKFRDSKVETTKSFQEQKHYHNMIWYSYLVKRNPCLARFLCLTLQTHVYSIVSQKNLQITSEICSLYFESKLPIAILNALLSTAQFSFMCIPLKVKRHEVDSVMIRNQLENLEYFSNIQSLFRLRVNKAKKQSA